jgi:hypothetical protein
LEKKIRTFGFFSGMNIGENEDSSSIEFRNYIQENAYGIDIVKSTKPALQDETFRLYHAYGDVYAYYMKMENVDYTWLRSITSISLDTQLLSKDQYKIERSSITNNRLYIKESVFDQQNVRTKTYQVRIVADGYEDVTANLTVTIDRATDFTIRVLDANGAVQQTKTFTMDEMISMSKEVEQYYVVAKQWVSKAYSVTGVTLSTLLEKSGISFREGQTIKFRTNEYAIDNNLAQNANAYEKSVTYEELMKSRYSFTDLSKNPLNDWEWITQFQNYTRIEVEPIFALKWAEGNLTQYIQPNINFGTSIEGRQFTFFAGIEFEVDEDGNEYAIRNESYMLDTVFGIDIVDTNLSLNVIPVVKDSYVYDGKAVEVSYEVKDSQGNVITDTSIYGLKLQSYYREASIEQWIEGLPVNVGTYEVQYRVVSYQSTEDIVFTSETSIINIKNKTVTEVDKPEDDKSEVDKPTVEDPLVPITGTTVKGDITIASVRQSMMNAAVIKMNELIANDMSKVLEELAEKLTSAEQREAYAQLQAALEDDTREITPELYTIVDLKPTGNPDANGDYWVTLSNEKIEKDTMIVVLHYKEAEEEWETIVPEEVTDGQIIFKTKSFSPFAVVGVGATEGTGNSSDSDGIQTGDDTSKVQIAMWLMLVLSAGTAAVVARRKRRVE